ncbi:right-handed parallel beta-helix repeat-containing protein [Sphingobacterium multivorum]|uniref:Right handed beta helix domain-containing protein n=2 Tax=Sphingobacterium TaxID=28453 RepID=A0A2X2J463_SPHMU|nr:right-handed parallel beta-helix repeat-containing protein [Sphingobacterium multivorum]QRQ60567.1 right-handed parallel beta-helix repeat-containing protein [Sphingobacterium multivorum]SPZ87141.1 Uncharacterised protein [Sphingobacterium multivorum]
MKHLRRALTLARKIFWYSLFYFIPFYSFGQLQLVVSPDGSEHGDGSLAHPLASVAQALTLLRTQRGEKPERTAFVLLRGGTYFFDSGISLDERDSHTIIQAYGNERVIFKGSIPLSTTGLFRTRENGSINFYQLNLLEHGVKDLGQLRQVGFSRASGNAPGELFVDGIAFHLARWPNQGMVPMGKVIDTGSIPRNRDSSNRGGVFQYKESRIDAWAKEDDPWIAGYFKWGYADDMVRVKTIDQNKKTITTKEPTLYGFDYKKKYRQWRGINLLVELDTVGEFYLDRKHGVLSFAVDKPIKTLSYSVLEEPFFSLIGTQHTQIRGIEFEESRGMGVYLRDTYAVEIDACRFSNLGSLGVAVGYGIKPFERLQHEGTGEALDNSIGDLHQHLYSHPTFDQKGGEQNVIRHCHFSHLGAGGVSLSGGDRSKLTKGNNRIEDCIFFDLNRLERSYRPAIALYGVGNTVKNCEISDLPSMAILIHGNEHKIEYNYIHKVAQEVDDQGAIYIGRDPSERHNLIQYNLLANIPKTLRTSGIYHDDASSGTKVFGNIFVNAGERSVFIGGGSDNWYVNNLFVSAGRWAVRVDNRLENWLKNLNVYGSGHLFYDRLVGVNYLISPYREAYPELALQFSRNGKPTGNVFQDNRFYNCKHILKGKRKWLAWDQSNKEGFLLDFRRDFQTMNLKDLKVVLGTKALEQQIPIDNIGPQ